ncbi:MAG: PIN domain-containing protein [Bacilli bacterium]|nr:PIN domain-containing protein [Bacilli bacterium]
MRILFDTNVILDILLKRKEFLDNSLGSVKTALHQGDCCMLSSSVITDIFYLARKFYSDKEKAMQCVITSVSLFKLAPVTEECIVCSLGKEFSTFEDAVIDSVATNCQADCIVTRNKADFKKSKNIVFTPQEFIEFRK